MRHIWLAGAALPLMLQSTAAFAQDAGVPQSEAQPEPAAEQGAAPTGARSEPDEIIITARRRQESILRVPVVATVLDQRIIEDQQVDDLYAVVNLVPGFQMSESVGTVGIQTSIRGIGPTSQTPSVDQSVSLNIDGLQLTQGFAFNAGLFDVAQVEVLRGPQALFFGKNSPAGVISLRTADPTENFEFITRASYEFEAAQRVGEVILSGPVTDTLRLRLAGRWSDQDGFFRNTGVPFAPNRGVVAPRYRDFSPREELFLRGTALWEPGLGYSARLKVNYVTMRMDGSGGDGQVVLCPDGRGGVPPLNFPFLNDQDCRLDRNVQLGDMDPAFWPGIRNNGVPFSDSTQVFGTLEQNVRLSPEITFTSVTGYYDLSQDVLIRGSGSSNPTIAPDFHFDNTQWTQEVRLASDFRDFPLNFTIGGFYQQGRFISDNRLRGNTAFGLPALLQSVKHEIDIYSASLFGQLLWQITPELELAGGARYTNEVRRHREQNFLAGGAFVNLLVPRLEANNVSPEFSLTYAPTENFSIFGSYRQGFKSGSFNTIVFIDANTRADFGDERAEGFEVGARARLLDRRLALNLALYNYDYSDLQVGANEVTSTGGIVLRTINAASARVQGVEFDVNYQPAEVEGLTLRAAVNYNRARFDSFTNAPCGNGQTIAQGCNQILNPTTGRFTSQDLSGRPLVRAPDWSGNAGVSYDTSIGGNVRLSMGATATYSSEFFTNLVQLPDYVQPEYVKVGANIAIRDEDNRWELSLVGNNLTNEITAAYCSNANTQAGSVFGGQIAGAATQGPAGSDELGCIAERGRELWVRLTIRPGELFGRR